MTRSTNKPTIREQLDAIRPDSDDLRDGDLHEAARRIEESDGWRAAFERQQSIDRDVATAMQDVVVPDGLKLRLLDSLATAREEAPIEVDPEVASAAPKRTWRLAAMAATLLVAATLGWMIMPADGSLITLDEARHSLLTSDQGVIDTSQLETFDGSFLFELPDAGWVQQTYMADELRGIDWTGDARHDGAVYEFHVKGRLHGYLLVLPASRLSDPPTLTRLSTSSVDYRPVVNAAWVDQTTGLAYICFVDQGDLETLQRLLYPHTA